MSRIALPSLLLASICYTTFPTIASTLAINIHDAYDGGAGPTYYGAETLNLILNDNSNQFIQNMHNFCALLFSLLTGYTFAFVYRQQEKVYYALFEEVSAVTSLLEQIALATEGRSGVYRMLLENVRTYVRYDMRMKFIPTDTTTTTTTTTTIPTPHSPEDIPALLLSTRPTNKAPLETILYITSVGTPNPIYSTIRQLRQARSRRLAAMQRKIPEINLYMLYILGSMAFVTFPIIAAGSSTVGGDALLNVQRVQLSLGVAAMGGVLGVVNELKVPGLGGGEGGGLGSVYDVDFLVLETLLDGLEDEISLRMRRCDEIEVGGKGGGGGDEMVSSLVANNSLTANSGIDGDRSIASTNHERRIEDDDRNDDTEEIRRKPRMFRRLLDKIRRRRS